MIFITTANILFLKRVQQGPLGPLLFCLHNDVLHSLMSLLCGYLMILHGGSVEHTDDIDNYNTVLVY